MDGIETAPRALQSGQALTLDHSTTPGCTWSITESSTSPSRTPSYRLSTYTPSMPSELIHRRKARSSRESPTSSSSSLERGVWRRGESRGRA